MYDHELVVSVAAEIIVWQDAAQHLPLPELQDMLATWQRSLAKNLDTLNATYAAHGGHHECTDIIQHAIADVTRSATATAIYTLGISQRIRQAAHQN